LRQDINDNLKRVFNAVLEEDVPDRFKQLLAQLKAKEASDSDPSNSDAAAQEDPAADPGSSGGAKKAVKQ
jgi:hypothetical protein